MFESVMYGGIGELIRMLNISVTIILVLIIIPAILAAVFSILAYRNSKKILKELQKNKSESGEL